jgi:Flp pilus assembly protein TadD
LGTALRDQGHFAEAANCYQRALQLKADHAEAHNGLGTTFQEQGELDEALT